MKQTSDRDIIGKKRISFKDKKELMDYYEQKYKNGGYSNGCVVNGVPLSQIYHEGRQNSAFNLLNPSKNEKILDAGCGIGTLTSKIVKKSDKVYGVDIAKNAFYSNKNLSPFSKMDLENLAFKNESFDKIVIVETLEHLINPEKAIEEFYRVLKPEGHLVITYPLINANQIAKLEIALKIRKPLEISEHLSEWDYPTLIKHFESKGFKYKKSEGIVFDFGALKRIKRISANLTKGFTKLELSIKKFPKNSMWASFLFEK